MKIRETSRQAAEQIKHVAGNLQSKVEQHIISCGARGATDDEIQVALNLGPQTQSARRRELEQQGRVKDSGERRNTRKGRKAIVWIAANIPFPINDLFARKGLNFKPRRKVTNDDFKNRISELETELMKSRRKIATFKNIILDALDCLENPTGYSHNELVRRCSMVIETLREGT